ncbi:MAG: pseudaminic acid cytidylyltransferase [Gammaproteobacteria bacterium]|nr:pseudaminic acid cytidylyltransferase [Gammaproteobacteria bacterium]
MNVAIIPARGGSKRIPGKNIREFCGKPMIAWSIETALNSGCFDRIIVSTDDPDIAAIARNHGAETPFSRPPELSNDTAGTSPVIRHAVEWLLADGAAIDFACCIYATAPFISADSLRTGLQLIEKDTADFAFPVTPYPYPIQRALKIEQGRVSMLDPGLYQTRSQDLEPAWHDVGQFYWGTKDAWLQEKPILDSKALPLILPVDEVQDIDTPDDWERAEWMFRARQLRQERSAA